MPGLLRNLLAFGVALAIFAAGAVVGAVVDRHLVYAHRAGNVHSHSHSHDHLLEMLRRHLNLSDDQAQQIAAIMESTSTEVESILAEKRELHERTQQQILEVLTEEQAAKYRAMIERARWIHGEPGPP